MSSATRALHRLATSLGVATTYVDGLGRRVDVSDDTLLAVCRSLGALLERPDEASEALAAGAADAERRSVPPTVVAWDGRLDPAIAAAPGVSLALEDGTSVALTETLPPGRHRLAVAADGRIDEAVVIAAPVRTWRRPDDRPGWGVSAQVTALRTSRSRSVADLADLMTLCGWVADRGGDLVTTLPLLPTFDSLPVEPSPYAPVSRLFWSELLLDLGDAHVPVGGRVRLDHTAASAEVRRALDGHAPSEPVEAELARYAAFRGAQARLGRDWRRWPADAGPQHLDRSHVDADEERFHVVAQMATARQLEALRSPLDRIGVRLGLDLTVGVHPLGYDAWSRPHLFASGIAVGAPPDRGFPSGQSWGFPPVLPAASTAEGHAYLAAAIGHQAAMAGLLRLDHVMAMRRLYWIPDGMDLHEGTYVDYPIEELFALLSLASHRHRCELVGENLGTVPDDIKAALPRHGIRGMYLAEFSAAAGDPVADPSPDEVALVDTHDTPTLAGWVTGTDIDERVRLGLLDPGAEAGERTARAVAVAALASHVGVSPVTPTDVVDPAELLERVLVWLGGSTSPLVSIWLEDLWLEVEPVNVPGSGSAERPNWQRPLAGLLDELLLDPEVRRRAELLTAAIRGR